MSIKTSKTFTLVSSILFFIFGILTLISYIAVSYGNESFESMLKICVTLSIMSVLFHIYGLWGTITNLIDKVSANEERSKKNERRSKENKKAIKGE